jgi:hypothetical protein
VTVEDRSSAWPVTGIGNAWSCEYFDGPFYLFAAPADRPAISLVFVQTRDGNTGAPNPEDLGGGPTDKHLIYEGLRVSPPTRCWPAPRASDTRSSSVNQPSCRAAARAGLARHPAQMVISNDGNFDLGARVFSTPDVPVFLLAGDACIRKVADEIARRPWITLIPTNDDLPATFARLRHDHGIGRISAVGGRTTATASSMRVSSRISI